MKENLVSVCVGMLLVLTATVAFASDMLSINTSTSYLNEVNELRKKNEKVVFFEFHQSLPNESEIRRIMGDTKATSGNLDPSQLLKLPAKVSPDFGIPNLGEISTRSTKLTKSGWIVVGPDLTELWERKYKNPMAHEIEVTQNFHGSFEDFRKQYLGGVTVALGIDMLKIYNAFDSDEASLNCKTVKFFYGIGYTVNVKKQKAPEIRGTDPFVDVWLLRD